MMIAALLAVSASSNHAQQSSESDVDTLLRADASQRAMWASTWLHSGDPRKVAWGAWLVRADHLKSLIPVLVQLVIDYKSPGDAPLSADVAA